MTVEETGRADQTIRVTEGFFIPLQPGPLVHELTFIDWVRAVRRRYRLVAAITVSITLLTGIVAFCMTPIFQAKMLLVPTLADSGGNGSAVLSSISSVAALAGVGGGGIAINPNEEAIAILRSTALTEGFIKDENLLPVLFEDGWDQKAGKWKSDDPKDIPTLWLADTMFDKTIRQLDEDQQTGLVTMTIEWKDPVLAAKWANELVARANEALRQDAIRRGNDNIAFLNDRIEKTSAVELRQAIYDLIEQELKKVMVAQGNADYAFRVIDPAVVPELKKRPRRTLMVMVAFIASLTLSIVFVALSTPRVRP